jgi:hypothetical protein
LEDVAVLGELLSSGALEDALDGYEQPPQASSRASPPIHVRLVAARRTATIQVPANVR